MHCVKLLGHRLVACNFDRQVSELQARIAVLNSDIALGKAVTRPPDKSVGGTGTSGCQPICATTSCSPERLTSHPSTTGHPTFALVLKVIRQSTELPDPIGTAHPNRSDRRECPLDVPRYSVFPLTAGPPTARPLHFRVGSRHARRKTRAEVARGDQGGMAAPPTAGDRHVRPGNALDAEDEYDSKARKTVVPD